MSKIQMKIVVAISMLALLTMTGCVTRSQDAENSREAFLAGQKAAYESMGQSMLDVVILGEVQKHQIPWVAGLTLAHAIETANYTGAHDPTEIVVKRNSTETRVDPKALLSGKDMALEPGDTIMVIGK